MNNFSYKTAFVLPTGMVLGGVNTWSVDMCRRLSACGKQTVLIQHTNSEQILNIPNLEDVHSILCDGPPAHIAKFEDLADFVRVYNNITPCVFIPNWSTGSYATCALLSLKNADVMRVIGMAHADNEYYYGWLQHYEPIIQTFIAVSNEVASNLVRIIPNREKDIVVKPYAVDVLAELNRSYSLEGNPIQIVYAGRISRGQKRAQDLFKLIKALENHCIDFSFRIIGEGDYKDKLSEEIGSLSQSTQSRVIIQSALSPDQMAGVWKTNDVFLLVSAYEGTSIAMLEAMGKGCIPVVTEVSGTRAVIRNGINGFVVKVGQIEEMARLIGVLASDRKKLTKLGRKAHETIRNRLSFNEYTRWMSGLVEEVWSQNPRYWPWGRPVYPITGMTGKRYGNYIKNIGNNFEALPEVLRDYTLMIQGFHLYEASNQYENLLNEKNDLQANYHRITNRPLFRMYHAIKKIWNKLHIPTSD